MKAMRNGYLRRTLAVWPLVLVTCGALLFVAGAQAVHGGPFELDGDAVSATSQDWDQVCPSGHPSGAASCVGGSAAVWSFFGEDDGRIYPGGSTKDDHDISGWRHTEGSVPDKDDLLHGFAARYGSTVYFGADRYANNGDAQLGVWFLQSKVNAITSGANAGTFAGAHQDGDVLVLSDFTNGGDVSTVNVYRWNGPGGSIQGQGAIDGTLDLIGGQGPTPSDCASAQIPANDSFCATVNKSAQPSPWAFQPKGGAAGTFGISEFFEGGIDLRALGLGEECFGSVILETRSSPSVDAVLKDYIAGSFERCGAVIGITPSGVYEVGTTRTFSVHVAGSMGGVVTPAHGIKPTVTLTASNGADVSNVVDNCATSGTDANGDCTVTFTSNSAGTVT